MVEKKKIERVGGRGHRDAAESRVASEGVLEAGFDDSDVEELPHAHHHHDEAVEAVLAEQLSSWTHRLLLLLFHLLARPLPGLYRQSPRLCLPLSLHLEDQLSMCKRGERLPILIAGLFGAPPFSILVKDDNTL